MKINATITPQAFARLCDAVSNEEWPMVPVAKNHLRFVTIKRFKGEGATAVEVELELIVRKNDGNDQYDEAAPALVERGELNKLLDILGIFPQGLPADEAKRRDARTFAIEGLESAQRALFPLEHLGSSDNVTTEVHDTIKRVSETCARVQALIAKYL